MRTDRRSRVARVRGLALAVLNALVVLVVLVGAVSAGPLAAAPRQTARPQTVPLQATPQPAVPPGENVLRDRIVAVVDEDPILQSDLDRLIALGLAQPQPGEDEPAFRRRALDQMIDNRLRLHEIDRFGLEQVPVDEIEARVARIRQGFPDEPAFLDTLRRVGLTMTTLRQLVARQLVVMTYVNKRLGPRVFVDAQDIQQYYQGTLVPEMRRRGQPVPPLEDVREEIRKVLREQRLNAEIRRWTAELHRDADIAVYLDPPQQPLPPVVHRVEGKPKPEG